MIRKLILAFAAFIPATLQAQPARPAAPLWAATADRHELVPARTSLPRTAGAVTIAQARDPRPDGSDSNLLYRSADGEIIATVYLYYPGLAHSGLAAYATDRGIRANSRSQVESAAPRTVDAGGVTGAAIRIDYRNYMGPNASTAAFVKAGRWMIKFRVTGPEARRVEVMAAMDALLAGIRFNPAESARPAAPIAVTDCPSGAAQSDATLLPDPPQRELGAYGFLATMDGGGMMASERESGRPVLLPSRVPDRLCVSSRIGEAGTPILRDHGGAIEGVDGRSRAIVIISDSGTLLEIVEVPTLRRVVLLHHQIGATRALGSYDGVPSDRQILAYFGGGASEATRQRVPVIFRPGRGPEMQLPALSEQEPSPTT